MQNLQEEKKESLAIKIRSEKIELVPIDVPIPYEKNMHIHTDEQIDRLCDLIRYQGFRNPLVLQKGTNRIACGHGRLMAAKKMNMATVPAVYQEFESEEQFYAYVVSDNAIGKDTWAKLDFSKINNDFLEFGPELNVDMLGIKDFVVEPIEKLEPQCSADSVPGLKEDPVTKLGDAWLIGKHRLVCGDSTMIDDVEKLMKEDKADMVFTDPPYGISYQSNGRKDKFDVLENDDKFLDIVPIIELFSRGFVFIWSTWKVVDTWIEKTSALGKLSNMIVWAKGGGGLGDLKKTFSTDWELALVWHRGHDLTGKRIGSVWNIGKDASVEYMHPTQKPVALAEEALDKCSKTGYRILDLFAGSGSTMIACEKMSRVSLNMELDPRYCDVIIKRYQKFTGRDDVILESSGQKYNDLVKDKE